MKKKILLPTLLITLKLLREKNELKYLPKKRKGYSRVFIFGSGGTIGALWEILKIRNLNLLNLIKDDEENLLIGTSAGSIVASLLRSNITIDEIEKLFLERELEYNNETLQLDEFDFNNLPERKVKNVRDLFISAVKNKKIPNYKVLLSLSAYPGNYKLEKLEENVNKVLNKSWPKNEMWVVTTDVKNHRAKVFHNNSKHSPGFAVSASCSIPYLFKGNTYKDKLYLDGGIIDTLNYAIAPTPGLKETYIFDPIGGFKKLSKKDNNIEKILKMYLNLKEAKLKLYLLKKKIQGEKIILIRPNKIESEIMMKGLMNERLLPKLSKYMNSLIYEKN